MYTVGAGTLGEVVGLGAGFAIGLVVVQFPGLTFTTEVHPDYLNLV